MAALFDAVREGNRLLDEGGQPPEGLRSAWSRAIGVLDVLPEPQKIVSLSGTVIAPTPILSGKLSVRLPTPPDNPEEQDTWARGWAHERKAAKGRKDYKEADRIRDLLKAAGWEIRDNKDGSVEVRRI